MTNDSEIIPRKRRRLDASATLSKPFKSPFRSAPVECASGSTSSAESAVSSPTPACSTLPQSRTYKSRILARPTSEVLPQASQAETDEETLGLMQQKESLQSEVTNLRAVLDKMNQALRIERSGKDTELEALIIKWRCISQTAADEVFASAKERVDRMGGVSTWRQRRMRDSSQWGFDNSDVTDETNQYERDHVEKEEEAEKEFTMDFMLDTLNIEYALIGYEPQVGTWIEEF